MDIVAWPGYVERGDTDKNYDWVTAFEQETACKVNVKTAGTSDEMVSLMTQGGYDLVTASGDASMRLIRGGTVQPVDISRVPSYANVDERLKEAPWHFVDGKHYGTPYQWGPNVLMYNTKVFKTAPTSWSVVLGAAEVARRQAEQGTHPGLRRPDLHRGCGAVSDGASGRSSASRIRTSSTKSSTPRRSSCCASSIRSCIATGTTPTSRCRTSPTKAWSPRARGRSRSIRWWPTSSRSRARCPTEGATGWADTTMLATDAKHPNCAYRWMEWSLNAKVQGDLASWFGSVPAVPAACEGNALLGPEGCKTNGFENFDRIWFWRTPEATCAQGTCVPYSRWATDYVAVMGGR